MNSRRKLLGTPVILWIIAVVATGIVVTATILSSILSNLPQVNISWNQQIPSNTNVGHYYNWSINIQSPKTYDAARITVDLTSPVGFTDWNIINFTVRSLATGETQTLSDSPQGPPSEGHMFAYNNVFIAQGSNTPELTGSWQFNSKAPLATYTILAYLNPNPAGTQSSDIINATTTLSA